MPNITPRDKLYGIWYSIMGRCYKPGYTGWEKYGAKGIGVCERWHSFANFHDDVAPRPPGLTLDRKDSTKDYSPDNCRWADWATQVRNRPITVWIEHNGERLCTKDWADRAGINYQTFRDRLAAGWSMDDALSVKVSRSNAWRQRFLTT